MLEDDILCGPLLLYTVAKPTILVNYVFHKPSNTIQEVVFGYLSYLSSVS